MEPLTFPRRVYDKLYDMVRLTTEEVAVIDSPDFQRLRWICQTGLLKLIWPSATHTRFEHSIGVVQAAQHMLDALERSSTDDFAKLYDEYCDESHHGRAIRYCTVNQGIRGEIQRITRLCALVHDLGHGPFSHAFEVFAPPVSDVEKFIDDPRLSAIAPYRDLLLASKTGRITHEAVSCILFAALWHDLCGDPWMPGTVTAVLLNADPSPGAPSMLHRWIPMIRDIVTSAPLDADRLDYLARDAAATGVAYGQVDSYRILKSILCVYTRGPGCEAMRLGWRKSGLRAIEHAVVARFNMFAQVYHHKTLRATELMFRDMAAAAVESGENVLFEATSLDAFRRGFVAMSDDVFLRTLAGQIRPDFPRNERVRDIADKILRRKLYKRLFDFRREHAAGEPEAVHAALSAQFPDSRFILDRQQLKATKDLERGALLLELDETKRYSCASETLSWLDASPLIRTLRNEELAQVRLYVEPRRPPSRDKALAIRKAIFDSAAAYAVAATASAK